MSEYLKVPPFLLLDYRMCIYLYISKGKYLKEVNSMSKNEIEIDGEIYVKKASMTQAEEGGMPYVIARTYSAGVFAGFLKSREGKEVVLLTARRLWFWKGAASLSQLAVEGTKNPSECKFPCVVKKVILTEVIEIIPCTAVAMESIEGVPIWAM